MENEMIETKRTFDSFHPERRTLMGPGPSDVPPRVLEALSRPTVGHLDPSFSRMMEEVKELLRYAFQTENELTMPISAPGSTGMETCFLNLVEPGDEVVVCQNGVFGLRMKENVERAGGVPVVVEDEWGETVSPKKLERALEEHPQAKIAAFVHAETSTGVLSDAKSLVEVARRHGCLTIVDAVTSLGGVPVKTDEWGIDAIYSGTQKCLSCVPGLAPLSMSERAIEKVENRGEKVRSWFQDLNLLTGYWGSEGGRTYHHTAPVNSLYALHEALLMLHEEGLESAWKRHSGNHEALRNGLEAMGLSLVVAPEERLPQLNAVSVPEDVDEARVREGLLSDYDLEIGAGLGEMAGNVWRIGLMGHSSSRKNVLFCLSALEAVLREEGAEIERGRAVEAATVSYS
jgi:alanine-glyoxylate transaminase/serine-glyoxylate transaminase/serine-pyruvate transaminase